MLATESITPSLQLSVASPSVSSPRSPSSTPRVEHQDTIVITDENLSHSGSPSNDRILSTLQLQSTDQTDYLLSTPPSTNAAADASTRLVEDSGSNNKLSLSQTDNLGERSIPVTTASTKTQFSPTKTGQSDSSQTSSGTPKSNKTKHNVSSGSTGGKGEKVKYGELVVLGYNGSIPGGDSGRRRSKFSLFRRPCANGVKPSNKQFVTQHGDKKMPVDRSNSTASTPSTHCVSYTLSRTQTVTVEYEPDGDTDMFQVGRSSESQIDFVITDTVPGHQRLAGQTHVAQSTISRYSCRICVDREPPYTARIYAAGFDHNNHIFLGEKASKWSNKKSEMDGLTTNGILIVHPRGNFTEKDCQPGVWREVSVRGDIYSLRETRSIPSKSQRVDGESNVLVDGTLIDLCGATLVWRSHTGLQCSPTPHKLEEYIESINASRPQCPVGLNTLVLPKKNTAKVEKSKQPYVYLVCGHVHGEHSWGKEENTAKRTCPMCLKEGPFVRVQVGTEASLFTDNKKLTHAFTPCAHMTSEDTARYWSSVAIPYGCQGFRAMCPYCATPLTGPGKNGYIKLIFQDNTEF